MKKQPRFLLAMSGLLFGLISLSCNMSVPFLKPTSTPTPTETSTPTITPTITPDWLATRSAYSTQQKQAFIDELTAYWTDLGISVDPGEIAWSEEAEISVDSEGYHVTTIVPIATDLVASDFILTADITWTTNGLMICGVVFRSEANLEQGRQYQFAFLRLSGLPAWDIGFYKNGYYVNSILGQEKYSRALNLANGGTNQITLVARGNKFEVYINAVYQGQYVDYSSQATSGRFGVLAWQDTGWSNCTFEHTIIWVFDQP